MTRWGGQTRPINLHLEILKMDTLEQARVWISECVWGDIDGDDIPRLSDAQVHAGINRHYAGGWAQFVSDGE